MSLPGCLPARQPLLVGLACGNQSLKDHSRGQIEMQIARSIAWRGGWLVALALVLGCGKGEEVKRYTVNKPPPIEARGSDTSDPHAGLNLPGRGAAAVPTGEPTDRTLGAIVIHGGQGWFFKITGPAEAVGTASEAFTSYLKTLQFGGDGKPKWQLPSGWQERPGNEIRFATLLIPSEPKPLELSVTALPKSGDDDSYALVNVNRWRDQLQLPPVTLEQMKQESVAVPVGDSKATVVNVAGWAKAGGMGGPFMSGGRNGN
jgi:hypothetical protein